MKVANKKLLADLHKQTDGKQTTTLLKLWLI